MNLNKLIIESLHYSINNFILNESLTSKVYHFCNIDSFWGICKYNAFFLTSSNTNKSDERMSSVGGYKYPFYMCFSRTSYSNTGYQKQRLDSSSSSWKNCLVRIEIDGNKLNYLYKSHPINYFIDNDDDKIKPYLNGLNPNVDYKQIARQQMHEYEDRLLSNKNIIKNANYYIKRVDILIDRKLLTHKLMLNKHKMFGDILFNNKSIDNDKIFVYDDVISFNKMSMDGALTKNSINKELLLIKDKIKTNYENILSEGCLKHIGNALAVVTAYYSWNYSQNEKEIISELIDKYGFSQYKKELLNISINVLYNLYNNYSYIDKIIGFLSMSKPNFKNGGLWKYGILVDEMINDYCKYMNISYRTISLFIKGNYLAINSDEDNIRITPRYEKIINYINKQVENELYGVFLDCNNNKVNELKNM